MSETTLEPLAIAGQGAQAQPEPQPHPSRRLSKCTQCDWCCGIGHVGAMCAHPEQPVSLVDGTPLAECRLARMDDTRVTLRGTVVLCGTAGRLFSRAQR